jgi:hypothetical protein
MENMENVRKKESDNSIWDCLINHYVEIILNDGIDLTRPHIIKKTGLLIGSDYNFVFIRGKIKTEALAIKNIERIAELEEQVDITKVGGGE